MKTRKHLEGQIRGWLPKEPTLAHAAQESKRHWKPYLKTLSIVAVVFLLSSITFVGVRVYMRYSNPQLDVTASYYEKTSNSTAMSVGDVVEVQLKVYWHGYVLPEFKREVKIVDPFPESRFSLANGTNSLTQSEGYGGSYQLNYTLRVVGDGGLAELPKPRLYLNNIEIPLDNVNPTLKNALK